MLWNQNLCLPSTNKAGLTSDSGNSWTADTSQGTTSPKRPTPDLKLSTSGIRIRLRKWAWTSSPESVLCWTAHRQTLSNMHIADALWLYTAARFFVEMFGEFMPKFSMDFYTCGIMKKSIEVIILLSACRPNVNPITVWRNTFFQ